MAAGIPLDDEETTWINSYADEVCETFGAEFREAADRFARWKPLVQPFTQAVDCVLTHGHGYFSAVDEAHNELCIASAILANRSHRIVRLDYEPTLPGCAKSIDFRATAEDGTVFYADVKTIKPAAKDRWSNMKRRSKNSGSLRTSTSFCLRTGSAERCGIRCLRPAGECWNTRWNWRRRLRRPS